MGSIQKLPDHVINQIKAGEVVDRPVSVVKELVENAIDAGSRNVQVELIDGGKQLIRVSDDGKGMDADDLRGCLERHATSKLRSLSDLESIASLGFRGEAIPSIASVCHFSIRSRQPEASLGSEINVENGISSELASVGMPPGTVVSVRDLFINVPARQKFLKATATEFSHIHDFLFALGLAYPAVGLKFTHNGREVFSWKPQKDFESRFKSALGAESTDFVKVEYSRGSFRIFGFAGLPFSAKPLAKHFITFVNGRLVRDKVIRAGVLHAYNGLVMKGLVPSAIVFVTVDPTWIDVNVHPSKTELRFRDPAVVQDLISMAIQDDVKLALAQQSAPTPVQNATPVSQASPSFQGDMTPKYRDDFSNLASSRNSSLSLKSGYDVPRFPHVASLSASRSHAFPLSPEPSRDVDTKPLFEMSEGPFSRATFLGQYKNCYLLLESDGELWVIDQHAFHERILFEEYVKVSRDQGRIPSQDVLTPVIVPVPSGVPEIIAQESEKWSVLGFRVEPLSSDAVAIHSYPVLISADRIIPIFEEILSRLIAFLGIGSSDVHPVYLRAKEFQDDISALNRVSQSLSQENVYHYFYATMACHTAVRAGEPLSGELVRRLLLRARDVDFYAHCPHGRPVWRKFTEADVSLWFARV